MPRVRLSEPGPARSAEELLVRVRRRGEQLRRRRRVLLTGGTAAAVAAVAAVVAVAVPSPTAPRLRVVAPPPTAPRPGVVAPPTTAPGACPPSAFRLSPAPPPAGLTAGPGLAGNALARLRAGQTVTLYRGRAGSITLTRGVDNESFSVSAYAHGPHPLDALQVLGGATFYYPPDSGLPSGRIPFRYPSGTASVTDACDRYQLVGAGVDEAALVATAERLHPLGSQPVGPAPDPVASPFGSCPSPPPLAYDADAAANAVATARAAVSRLYTGTDTTGFQVTASGPATPVDRGQANAGYYVLPYGMCGSTVGARTYVVELYFPAMASRGADLSHGQLFVSRFPAGWQAWYRYH